MGLPSITFSAIGDIQTFRVPATGGYFIEAGGAQDAVHAERRGDIVKGMFYLDRGDVLKIVVGCRQPGVSQQRRMTCAGEGGTVVWRGAGELPLPAKLLLAAGGGPRDDLDAESPAWGATYNAGAFQAFEPAAHEGNGYVCITPLPVYARADAPVSPASSNPWATLSGAGDVYAQGAF